MNEQDKNRIAEALRQMSGQQSQASIARVLKVSSATISQIMHNNWELISDGLWRRLGSALRRDVSGWQMVDTSVSVKLTRLFSDAKGSEHGDSGVHAIVGDAGIGKSSVARHYASHHVHTYHLTCCEFWNRRSFLQELLVAMGADSSGYTVSEMMARAIGRLKSQDRPLVILDEADKLNDQVLYFFITLYNQLEDYCGLVLMGTDYLERRIVRGVGYRRKGYTEIYSRLGRRFLSLGCASAEDIARICTENGVHDGVRIQRIVSESEGDLRRVKKLVRAMLKRDLERASGGAKLG